MANKTTGIKLDAKKSKGAKSTSSTSTDKHPHYHPDEFVIKEMMHQKNCSREEAIKILRNPAE